MRGVRLPHPPSLSEKDLSDKPRFVQEHGPPTKKQLKAIAFRNERRQESLRSVDDSVGRIVDAIQARGQLDNTYFLFFADNGFFRGEHGFLKGKVRNYQPATHVPLIIRGPGLAQGKVSSELTVNPDIAATIFDIAGTTPDPGLPLDGRSLLPFAKDPTLRSSRPILLEQYTRPRGRLLLAGEAKVQERRRSPTTRRSSTTATSSSATPTASASSTTSSATRTRCARCTGPPAYHRVERFMGLELNLLRACDGAECRRNLVLYPPKPGLRGGGPQPIG